MGSFGQKAAFGLGASGGGLDQAAVDARINTLRPEAEYVKYREVANQAARLAITDFQTGDVVRQTDNQKRYRLIATPASTDSNWVEIGSGGNIYTENGTIGTGRAVALTDTLNFDSNTLVIDGTNNRVGIGIAAPLNPLHLVGSPRIVDGNQAAGKALISDANGVGTWQTINTTSIYNANGTIGTGRTVAVTDTVNFDSNTFVIDGTNNRIGMGTATPQTQLHLTGQIRIDGGVPGAGKVLTSDANGLATWEVNQAQNIYTANGTTGAGRTVGVTDTLNFDSNTLVIDGTNNRVGLGTATPATALNVAGETQIDPTNNNALILNPFGTSAGNTSSIAFRELAANGTNAVLFKSPDVLAADTQYTLPSALPTANGQVLSSTTA